MKQFVTRAVEQVTEQQGGEVTYPFEIDGVKCLAYQPTSGQLAIFTMMIADNQGWQTQTAGIVDFFMRLLDDSTRVYISQRLLNRKDSFEIDDVKDILIYLMEQWTANPTDEPSGSSSSQAPTGPDSKPVTAASTS